MDCVHGALPSAELGPGLHHILPSNMCFLRVYLRTPQGGAGKRTMVVQGGSGFVPRRNFRMLSSATREPFINQSPLWLQK